MNIARNNMNALLREINKEDLVNLALGDTSQTPIYETLRTYHRLVRAYHQFQRAKFKYLNDLPDDADLDSPSNGKIAD